jgi:hypothetical protein
MRTNPRERMDDSTEQRLLRLEQRATWYQRLLIAQGVLLGAVYIMGQAPPAFRAQAAVFEELDVQHIRLRAPFGNHPIIGMIDSDARGPLITVLPPTPLCAPICWTSARRMTAPTQRSLRAPTMRGSKQRMASTTCVASQPRTAQHLACSTRARRQRHTFRSLRTRRNVGLTCIVLARWQQASNNLPMVTRP